MGFMKHHACCSCFVEQVSLQLVLDIAEMIVLPCSCVTCSDDMQVSMGLSVVTRVLLAMLCRPGTCASSTAAAKMQTRRDSEAVVAGNWCTAAVALTALGQRWTHNAYNAACG